MAEWLPTLPRFVPPARSSTAIRPLPCSFQGLNMPEFRFSGFSKQKAASLNGGIPLFVGVLVVEPYYMGSILGPLIVGNSKT